VLGPGRLRRRNTVRRGADRMEGVAGHATMATA
jgi:hypothetical protein